MSNYLISGACLPVGIDADSLVSLNTVASHHNINPAAISLVIQTESEWHTQTTGSYYGLTQIGAVTMKEAGWGFGPGQFMKMTRTQQLEYYGKWLDFYRFNRQLDSLKIKFDSLSIPKQAAFLQGMQFSPNGMGWKMAFAIGKEHIRTTLSRQATFLGDTSIGAMAAYYARQILAHPPKFESLADLFHYRLKH